MEFRNLTPFPGLAFQALDQRNNLYHVVALRQTLSIRPDGFLEFPEEQEPLVVADQYFEGANASSVKQESDLAPFKPACDVVVIATAFAPLVYNCTSFQVRLRIVSAPMLDLSRSPRAHELYGLGEHVVLDKALTVTGRRFWQRQSRSNDWKLTSPEPISSLPLRYEYAFGGELKLLDVNARQRAVRLGQDPDPVPLLRHAVVETNPVGRGYAEDWYFKTNNLDQISAPQIEDPADPIHALGAPYSPQGFGAIARAWLPRRNLCGTADAAFARSDQWLPEDFDFAFWNGAHPDLQVPYLHGDESIELTNLTPEGHLRFPLPGHRPFVLVRYQSGEVEPAALNLDTLTINAEEMKVSLAHRLMITSKPKIRVLEARLITRDQWNAALSAPQSSQLSQRKEDLASSGLSPRGVPIAGGRYG